MDLKLGHYNKDGIKAVDVGGEVDIYTAPRLRELLIDLVSKNNYQLVVNLDKVGFHLCSLSCGHGHAWGWRGGHVYSAGHPRI